MFGIDDAIIAAVAPAAISAVGGLLGAKETNSAQDARQENAQQFNADQAEINRQWQERLSSTAYQRAMGDMKTAGLNPILAYSQGGASTPAGSAATSPTPAPVVNRYAAATDAASKTMASAAQVASIQNTNANTERTNAEKLNIQQDTYNKGLQAGLMQAQFTDSNNGVPSTYEQMRIANDSVRIANQAGLLVTQNNLTREQTNLVMQEVKNAQEENRRIKADTRSKEANAVLAELARSEAEATSKFWQGSFGGPYAAGWKHYVGNVHTALGAAAGLGGIGLKYGADQLRGGQVGIPRGMSPGQYLGFE